MTAPSPRTDIRKTKTIRLRTSPSFLPEKYRNRKGRIRIKFRPFVGERRFLRYKTFQQPSEWAPKNRNVTYGPLKGSKWDNNFMPHMRGILDASFYPSVRYIGNCKTPQTGSSAGVETALGYVADRRPGDTLIVYPDRDTGSKRFKDYLQPMFTKSPRLRKLMTGLADDASAFRIKLQAMLIYLGWSGSVTALGNVSAKYLIGDEIDKWQRHATKKEADTLQLFFERFRAFKYGAKCWLISTPSDIDGYIWVYMTKQAQVVFDYYMPCPECGIFHKVDFKHIRWPKDVRDAKLVEEQNLANYVFPCCGIVVDDDGRHDALKLGVWHERLSEDEEKAGKIGRELFRCLKETNPRKICFYSPGWISPLVTHSEIAAAWLRGLVNPGDLHYFDNQIAAKAHTPHRQLRQQDVLRKLKDDRPEGLVPGNNKVAALVAGVDTQDDGFFFSIRAFGWGRKMESWQIHHGEVDSFEALEEVLFDTHYRDADGLYYPVHKVVIDTGGHRTSEVYDFTRNNPERVSAYKGASGRKAKPKSKTILETYPNSDIKIPGGLELWICDSHHYKDELAKKLKIKNDAPGAYHFHTETTDELIDHYCAEFVNKKRNWECPAGKPNHYWDCGVMELVAADMIGVRWTPEPEQETEEAQTTEPVADQEAA